MKVEIFSCCCRSMDGHSHRVQSSCQLATQLCPGDGRNPQSVPLFRTGRLSVGAATFVSSRSRVVILTCHGRTLLSSGLKLTNISMANWYEDNANDPVLANNSLLSTFPSLSYGNTGLSCIGEMLPRLEKFQFMMTFPQKIQ